MASKLRDTLTAVVTGVSADGTSPTDLAAKWQDELRLAEDFFKDFHKQAKKANDRFLDNNKAGAGDAPGTQPLYRLNLYHANIETLQSMLYAKIPKAEADRRFFDPSDDVARVAAEMITRIIQNDMNDPDDTLNTVLKNALQDRLIAGLGSGRLKYYMEEAPVMEPTGEQATDPSTGEVATQKTDEWCDVIYTHWKDILWSPARVASELRWKAFRSYMNKEEVEKRWGAEVATAIPYGKDGQRFDDDRQASLKTKNAEAEIWEIWEYATKTTYWVVKGYPKILEQQTDPMELNGFYPDALPMLANASTSKYLPKPDYYFAQDIYTEIDELETRIALLTQAAKCVGVYDRSSKDIGRMLKEGVENELIPVDNWAMFAEKGGLKGMTDWLPLDSVVNAINVLSQQQASRINQLYQVTGLSDIMRGQATQTNVTATEQRIKEKFGSGRIQAIQDEFATFAADLLNKKVQLIQRFYDPQRIIALSNIMNSPDAQIVPQAIALIKNPEQFNMRIAVRSESMAQENLDAVREQRTNLIQGIAQFLGMVQPLVQQAPESAPFLMELLSFSVAGFNGAAEMEGIIDQFGAAVKQKLSQPAPPPPPDPAVQKAQADIQLAQQQAQLDAQSKQQEAQLAAQTAGQTAQIEMQKAQLDSQRSQQQMAADEAKAKQELELTQLQMQFDAAKARQELELVAQEHEFKMAEIAQKMKQDAQLHEQKMAEGRIAQDTAVAAKQNGAAAANAPRIRTVKRDSAGNISHIIDSSSGNN